MGKFLVAFTLISALAAGAAIYYLQVYAFYEPVTLSDTPSMQGETQIRLTSLTSGAPEPILVDDFQGIDADSSPLRFRACFKTPNSIAMLSETYVPYENPVPLIAPDWFGCFDAKQLGQDLKNGLAVAFLGEENIEYGIDRVIAVYDDGRAYVWHQINECGEVVFDGQPVPEGCPPPPERSE